MKTLFVTCLTMIYYVPLISSKRGLNSKSAIREVKDSIEQQFRKQIMTSNSISRLSRSVEHIQCHKNGCCRKYAGILKITASQLNEILPHYDEIEEIIIPQSTIKVYSCEKKDSTSCTPPNVQSFYRKYIANEVGLSGCCVPTGFDQVQVIVKYKNILNVEVVNLQTSPNGCQCRV